MPTYLGLDCGGTSTRAALISESGDILFEGRSGPGNWSSTPAPRLRAHVEEALAGCPQADVFCGCFAGLLTPQHESDAVALLTELTGAERGFARPDSHAVLAAAGPDATCAVIAGTGSLVFSLSDGKVVKNGGGGPLLGDHGSAFAMARNALRIAIFGSTVTAAVSDEFLAAMHDLLGTLDPNEIPAKIYADPSPAALVAKLCTPLARDLEKGVPYAVTVVRDEMRELANIVHGHLYYYHPEQKPWTIVLAGGLWDISPAFIHRFSESLSVMAGAKHAVVQKLAASPAVGAARLAQQLSS